MSYASNCGEADTAPLFEYSAAEAGQSRGHTILLDDFQESSVGMVEHHVGVVVADEIDIFGRVVGGDVIDGTVLDTRHLDQLKHRLAVLASAEADVVAVFGLHQQGELLSFADKGDAGFNLVFQFHCHYLGQSLCVRQSEPHGSR